MKVFTISPNIRTGDVSYSDYVLQILRYNETHIIVKVIETLNCEDKDIKGEEIILFINDYIFSDARPLFSKKEYCSFLCRCEIKL